MARRSTRARWDLMLNNIGFVCERPMREARVGPARVGATETPTDLDQRAIWQDIPREWKSFESGACHSQDIGVNGYAYSDGATGLWGPIMPIGQVRAMTSGFPTDLGYVRDAFEWKGYLHVVGQYKIGRVPPGGGVFETLIDVRVDTQGTSATEVQGAWLYKDHLYAGVADGVSTLGMVQYNGAGTWIEANGTPIVSRSYGASLYARIDGIGKFRMYATNSATTFAHTSAAAATTPTNGVFDDANWSTAIGATDGLAITDGTDIITGLVVAPSNILWLTEGGAMDVDNSPRVVNRTAYWKSFRSTGGKITNGLMMGDWALLPHANGLDRWHVNNNAMNGPTGWCGPGVGLENNTPVFGTPAAIEYWQGGAFVGLWNGTDSWLAYGRDRVEMGVPGVGPMVWQTFKKFAGAHISGLKACTGANGRPYLWIWTKVDSTGICAAYIMDLPDNGTAVQDFYFGSGMAFQETGEFYFTREALAHPSIYKALRRFELTAQDMNPASASVYANADGAGYVLQGTARANDAAFAATTARAKNLNLRMDLSGSTTAPPMVEALRLTQRYSVRRTEARVYTLRLGLADRTGVERRGRDPERLWTHLKDLLESGPCDAVDEIGTRLRVDVVDVRAVSAEKASNVSYPWERIAEVTIVVLYSAARYGSAVYGNDEYGT